VRNPNQLYGYEVVANVMPGCDIDPITSPRVRGFRVANGTVSGRVTYSADGSACPNVTVGAAPMDPEDQIKRSAHLAPGDDLTISRPTTFTTGWWTSVGPEPGPTNGFDYIGVARMSGNLDGVNVHESFFLKQEWNVADSAWDTFAGRFEDNGELTNPTPAVPINWQPTAHRITQVLGNWDFLGLRLTADSAFVVIGDTALFAGLAHGFFDNPATSLHPMPYNLDTVYVDEIRVYDGAAPEDLDELRDNRNLLLTGVNPNLMPTTLC
jgi:hypothetical protein